MPNPSQHVIAHVYIGANFVATDIFAARMNEQRILANKPRDSYIDDRKTVLTRDASYKRDAQDNVGRPVANWDTLVRLWVLNLSAKANQLKKM